MDCKGKLFCRGDCASERAISRRSAGCCGESEACVWRGKIVPTRLYHCFIPSSSQTKSSPACLDSSERQSAPRSCWEHGSAAAIECVIATQSMHDKRSSFEWRFVQLPIGPRSQRGHKRAIRSWRAKMRRLSPSSVAFSMFSFFSGFFHLLFHRCCIVFRIVFWTVFSSEISIFGSGKLNATSRPCWERSAYP